VICVFEIGVDLVLVFVGFGLFQICSHLPFSPHSKDHALHRDSVIGPKQTSLKKFIADCIAKYLRAPMTSNVEQFYVIQAVLLVRFLLCVIFLCLSFNCAT